MSKKKKGASQPLPYAVRIQQGKRLLEDTERQAIVHHCLTTMLEFGVLQDDTDTDYAMGALERRYEQIMGKGDDRA